MAQTEDYSFSRILAKAEAFNSTNLDYCLSKEGATALLCGDCPFYKEGEDEELECGAFRLLYRLLEKKILSPEDIVRAARD